MNNKHIKSETIILLMLAFFSIAIGIWSNFRQLWLESNGFSIGAISRLLSIGTVSSIFGIIIIIKLITPNKMRSFITFAICIKTLTMLSIFFLNNSPYTYFIKVAIIYDIMFEVLFFAGIYPLITLYKTNDELYSKRRLVEYLFKDIGILLTGLIIGRRLFKLTLNYNTCLALAIMCSTLSLIVILFLQEPKSTKIKNTTKYSVFLKKNKMIQLYMINSFICNLSFSIVIGLKMLIVTDHLNFSITKGTSFILLFALIGDIFGIIALKWLTPKNDYITITIKYGIRFIAYIIGFFADNLIVSILVFAWLLISSTAYENITDAPYLNIVPGEHQLINLNLRRITQTAGEALGIFLCGLVFSKGINYIYGVAAFIMIFQLMLAYYLAYIKRNGLQVHS